MPSSALAAPLIPSRTTSAKTLTKPAAPKYLNAIGQDPFE
jgi:hypothetical protein